MRYPIFWNTSYQDQFETLLGELHAYLVDNDLIDRLEYVRVTGYSVETTEPSFYNSATLSLQSQLETNGIKFINNVPELHWTQTPCTWSQPPAGWNCRKYGQATKAFWDMWIGTFTDVPLAVTVRFPNDTSNPSYDYLLGYQNSLDDYFGLNGKTDVILNTAHQTQTCNMQTLRTKLAALSASTRKVGWGDIHCNSDPTQSSHCCVRLDLAREAVGVSTSGQRYYPVSFARYVTLGKGVWGVPANASANVWTWADCQLAPVQCANQSPACAVNCGPPSCNDTETCMIDCSDPDNENNCNQFELDRECEDDGM